MKTTNQLSPRCIAYNEETGTICGEHAYIYDRQRGGLVCAMHHRESYPDGAEGEHAPAIDLAIQREGYEIELRLAHLRAHAVTSRIAKIFLARAGRCLPQVLPTSGNPLLGDTCPPGPGLTTYQMSSAEPGGAVLPARGSGNKAELTSVRDENQTARKDAGPGHTYPGDQGGRWGRKWG